MARKSRNKPRRSAAFTPGQKEAMIPTGTVNRFRAQHGRIEVEARDKTEKGHEVTFGQFVATPVRKLLEAQHITLEEAAASWHWERDRDIARYASKNILDGDVIDGGGGGGKHAEMLRRSRHERRFQAACRALGEFLPIAEAAILDGSESLTQFGKQFMPALRRQEAVSVGRAFLVFALRRLAAFYGGFRMETDTSVQAIIAGMR